MNSPSLQPARRAHHGPRLLPVTSRILGATFIALTLGACANSNPQSRITNNPAIFQSLSPEHRQLVASGVIREGMTKDAVFLAWGRPDRISRGSRSTQVFETWTYLEYERVRRQQIGIGAGYGHYGHGRYSRYGRHGHRCPSYYGGYGYDPFYHGGSTVDYVPVMGAEVIFIGGRVSEWVVKQ